MTVKNPPEGYRTVTPNITVDGAGDAIAFYVKAFDAVEVLRLPMGDKLAHAEIRIGDSIVMLSDEFAEMDAFGPKTRGGATGGLMLYLDDVDAAFAQAVAAGCTVERPVEDMFWGDRMGSVIDPFGHKWSLATHVEDLDEAEIGKRMAAFSAGG